MRKIVTALILVAFWAQPAIAAKVAMKSPYPNGIYSYVECIDHIDPWLTSKGYKVYAVWYVPEAYVLVDPRTLGEESATMKIIGHTHYMMELKVK